MSIEGVPEKKKQPELPPELLSKVRENLIAEFERSIQIYTHEGTQEWINEKPLRDAIKDLREGKPLLYGSFLVYDLLDFAVSQAYTDLGREWTPNESHEIKRQIFDKDSLLGA